MQPMEDVVDSRAERTGFSGIVRVERSGSIELAKAYGLADRGHAGGHAGRSPTRCSPSVSR